MATTKKRPKTLRKPAAAKTSKASKPTKTVTLEELTADFEKKPAPAKRAVSVEKVEATTEAPKRRKVLGIKRREKPSVMPARLPNSFRITQKAVLVLWNNKKLFLLVALLYGFLNFLLVSGINSASSLTQTKSLFNGASGVGQVSKGVALLGVLVTSKASNLGSGPSVVQTFVVLVTSLAIIWLLRHVMAGEKVRMRDGFYRGMYPIVPVLLVLAVIILQFIPFLIGSSIFNVLVGNGIVISPIEIILASLFYFLCILLTLYWLSSSVVAAYIVTLPDMTPLKALRSARDLVRWRRWSVLRKLLFLPFALVVAIAAIMVPVVLMVTPAAPYVFFVLSMLSILVVHSYLYTLYRELLA